MAADRAINMALRVLGVGEVERDFKRVGAAGEKSFSEVKKAANGAAQEVSEYTARLRRTVQQAKTDFANLQELNKGSPTEVAAARRNFIATRVGIEQDRILQGVPEATRNLDAMEGAATRSGLSVSRLSALGAAAGAGLYALARGVKASIDAFLEEEAALDRFHAELKLAGNASLATAGDIEAMAERVEKATLQTAEAARDGATLLATVPDLTQEAMEQALESSARLADALGKDVAEVIEKYVRPAFEALAEKDMKALWEATEELSPSLRVAVQRLAEAGKSAEAQQALLNGLRDAAGDKPNGLTKATKDLTTAWDDLLVSMGKRFEKPVEVGLKTITALVRALANETRGAREEYDELQRSAQSGVRFVDFIRGKRAPVTASSTGSFSTANDGLFPGLPSLEQLSERDARRAEKAFDKQYETEAKKRDRTGGTRSVSSAEVARILKDAFGGRITSTDRSVAENKRVGGADASYHLFGRAVDFVPRGGMGSISKDQIRSVLESYGIDVQELLGPGDKGHDDHYHVGFGKTKIGPDQIARAREKAAQDELRRQQAVVSANEQLDDQLLAAKRANTDDAVELADLARQALQTETERQLAAIAAKVATGDYSEAEAQALGEKVKQLATEKLRTIDAEEAQALAQKRARAEEEAFRTWLAANDTQRELLQLADAMATTQAERRSIQLELLELDYREERAALERVLATEQDLELRKRAADRMAQLDRIFAGRMEDALRRTAGPAEGFLRDLNDNAKAQGERVEAVYVGALGSLSGDLASAIVNFERLDQVAQKALQGIATRLLEIGIEQYLVKPLTEQLFPDAAAAAGAQDGAGLAAAGGTLITAGGTLTSAGAALTGAGQLWLGVAAQLQAAAAALVSAQAAGAVSGGIGGIAGLFGSGVTSGGVHAAIPGFAGGTDNVPIGRPFWIGENGREMMERTASGGLRVYTNQQARRMVEGGGGGLSLVQNFTIPPRADPRSTASGVARATQGALARSHRKGLAMAGGNRP